MAIANITNNILTDSGIATSSLVPYTGATTNVDLGFFNFDANQINGFKIIAKLDGTNSGSLILRTGTSGYSYGNDSISLISSPTSANTLTIISDISSVTKIAQFGLGSLTATRTYTLPDASGTIALTSNLSDFVTLSTYQTITANKTFSGWIQANTLFLSNSSSVSSATGFGTLTYNKSGSVSTLRITNDNNATASLIFDNTTNYNYTFPATTGTIALTSDLSSYLPLTGGTLTGGLSGTTATFSGLGTFYQLTMTGATAGRIFYAQTGGVVSQSGNLNWNETNGMLGVGTPNPSAVITAFSTNAATQFKAAGTAPAFTFSQSLTTSTYACVFGLATSANHFITGTAAGDMAIANQSATAGAIVFGTGTAEKMRMSPSGNFGIGTSTPTERLEILGPDGSGAAVRWRMAGGRKSGYLYSDSAGVAIYDTNLNDAGIYLAQNTQIDFRVNGSQRMLINSSGNVGIGTSSPTTYSLAGRHLELNDAGGGYAFYHNNSTSVKSFYAVNESEGTAGLYTFSNHALKLGTNNTERMRITSGGDVLIGTTSNGNSSKLVLFGGASANTLECVHTGTADTFNLIFTNGNGLVGSIRTSGSTTTYYTTSDYRLKQDFKDYNGLNLVSAIKTYDYEWKSDKSRMYGVVAHELQEVLPYAVAGEKDGELMQQIDYSKIVPILVKAIQELNERIKQLENK